jgi:hypothetical protein
MTKTASRSWCVLASLSLLPASVHCSAGSTADSAPAASFRVRSEVRVSPTEIYRDETQFAGRYAAVMAGGEIEAVVDLDKRSWHDLQGDKGVTTLEQAEDWARTTAHEMQQKIATLPEAEGRGFYQALLQPNFEITEGKDQLVFHNEFMRYTVSVAPAAPEMVRRFFTHDRLESYHRAMKPGQVPPFPPLAVAAALESRSLLPKVVEVAIRSPEGAHAYTATYTIEPIPEAAARELQLALRARGFGD